MTQLKKFIKNTKDKLNLSCHIIFKLGILILTAFLLAGLTVGSSEAATGLKIYDYTTKKTTTYTDKQLKVTLNGALISSSKYPGILVNGIALLPYYETFDASDIDADCVYNDKTGAISISIYGIKIEMKIGSKSARVNGKAYTMPVAPMKLKYVSANKMKVLVPSRFVAEKLGLGYTWYSTKNTVAIEKHSMQLSYNGGKKFDYTGAFGKVTVDGKNINLGTAPSIIIDNTAMLSAYKVFAGSSINADYTYNQSKQKLTFARGDNVLEMTIGDKTAYLNKKPLSLSTAPVYVTNYETNSSYVMVPGSITASCLGYDYEWNNTARTSVITSRADTGLEDNDAEDEEDTEDNDPELGDSGNISDTGTLLGQWTAPELQYGRSSGLSELNAGISTNQGMIYSVTRDYSKIKMNSETFMVQANSPFSRVTSAKSGSIITLQADHMSCTDQSYQLLGTSSSLVNRITTNNQGADLSSRIEIELCKDIYRYDIALSPDNLILYITVYKNALTSASVGTNESGDYLVLSGIDPLNAVITEAAGFIYIDLPDTVNCLGDLNSQLSGSKYIKQLFSVNAADKTQLILSVKSGYQYEKQENGNQFTISFPAGDTSQGKPDIPVAGDKDKYEIIIPKPAEITSAMISDEDYYYNNYFEILLEGDYTGVIKADNIINKSAAVSKIAVSLNSSGNTVIKCSTTKLQGYQLACDNENIYIDVGNPKDIYKNIVVLDPGHGGPAVGASSNGHYEKDINFKILYTIGKKYFNQDTSKLKVYYTRTSDVDLTLKERAAFTSKVGADLFVSLHMNSAVGAPTAKGTEVFYSHNNNSANKAGLTSQKLASYLVENLVDALSSDNRGVKENVYTVIDSNTVPAVLIELGFLSNTSDYTMIMDSGNQETAAETIYNTLLQVFELYPTGR